MSSVNAADDIAEFLATRRAKITPEQVGLPSYGTRRVPGLRREEVASLAGVSADYYRRLERGQVSGVSELVLEALARAGDQVLGSDGRRPEPGRRLAPMDHRRGGERCGASAPTGSTSTSRRPSRADVDETLGALTDLVRPGKVRSIGSSSFSAGQIVEAQWTARDRHLQRFRTDSRPYSLLVRGIELDVLPTAQRHGMGTLTYSPLAGGWLSGSWAADSSPTSPARQRLAARFDMSLPENQRKLDAVGSSREVAEDAGLSLIELAIAFVVNHPAVTSAIIGPRTMEQLDGQLPAAEVVLDAASSTGSTRSSARRQPQPGRHELRRAVARPGLRRR